MTVAWQRNSATTTVIIENHNSDSDKQEKLYKTKHTHKYNETEYVNAK